MQRIGLFCTSHLSPCLWQRGSAVIGSELRLKISNAFMNALRSSLEDTSSYEGRRMHPSGSAETMWQIPSTPFQSFPSRMRRAISRLASSPMPYTMASALESKRIDLLTESDQKS